MSNEGQKEITGVYNAIMKAYSEKDYKEFLEMFKEPDNRRLEESSTVKLLSKILTDTHSKKHYTLKAGKKLYRSRSVSADNLNKLSFNETDGFFGFDKYDSKEPPLGLSKSGRNNYMGVSHIYLAEDKYTACVEIRPLPKSLISLATFRVKKTMKLLDMSLSSKCESNMQDTSEISADDFLLSKMKMQFTIPVRDEKEYYPSQYLSDHIRKYGFDGIRYQSGYSGGYCYTIFNCSEENIQFLSSELLYSQTPKYQIYYLNDDKVLPPPDKWNALFEMTPDTRNQIVEKLKIQVERSQNHGHA